MSVVVRKGVPSYDEELETLEYAIELLAEYVPEEEVRQKLKDAMEELREAHEERARRMEEQFSREVRARRDLIIGKDVRRI